MIQHEEKGSGEGISFRSRMFELSIGKVVALALLAMLLILILARPEILETLSGLF